jgi:HK97 family phage portal protein
MSFVSKIKSGIAKSLFGIDVDIIRRGGIRLGGFSYSGRNTPVWDNILEASYQINQYEQNPILHATLNIIADAASNAIYQIKDSKTGDIIPESEYTEDQKKALNLFTKPNPHQSGKEFDRQFSIQYNTFGKGYLYGLSPSSFTFDYKNVEVLNTLYPYNVAPVLTGNRITATELSEIVSGYVYKENGRELKEVLPPEQVLLLNEATISEDEEWFTGKSKLISLQRPLSNIMAAYEAINVTLKNRGIEVIFTPKPSPEIAGIPFQPHEKDSLEAELESYGNLEGQKRWMVGSLPVDVTQITSKMRDMMLFETIAADAIAVAHAYGVPEVLVKMYIQGATFENQEISEKRLYQNTIIPFVNEITESRNEWLKIKESGFEVVSSFDHIPVLQKDKLKEAQADDKKARKNIELFKAGLVKGNVVITSQGLPEDDQIGDKYIWELDDRQIFIILGRESKEDPQENNNQNNNDGTS